MNAGRQPDPLNTHDALIDEVRSIRQDIASQFGNDVGRLCAHLREVEGDYVARRGMYAGLSREDAARVVASWGEDSLRTDDPIVDEVRAIRKGLAEKKP